MLSNRKNKQWRERFVDRRLVPHYIIVFQLDTIQAKVKVEAQSVDTKTKELLEDWRRRNPLEYALSLKCCMRDMAFSS